MAAETALAPRDDRLAQIARTLRLGVIAHGVIVALLMVGGLVAAAQAGPTLLAAVQRIFLGGYSGAPDAGILLAILTGLINISLLLVFTVGTLAREYWTLPGLILFALANGAALVTLGYLPGLITIGAVIWALWLLRSGRILQANPMMIRELRGRMRGARAFVVMTIYLILMSSFALLLYIVFGSLNSLNASAATGQVGRVLFAGVVGIELLLIMFIAPSFTAGAVTGERERQTYDLLRTTLLPTPSFIIGKLESSLGYILLLLLAAVPLQSIAFLFGGVGEVELVLAFVILGITAITFGTVGIYFSATQPRTLSASARTYAMIGIWAFVVPLGASFVIGAVQGALFGGANAAPMPGLEAALHYFGLIATGLNPFSTAVATQRLLVGQQVSGFYDLTLASNGGTIPMVSPWIVFTTLYLMIAAVLIVLTVRRTRIVDASM